MSDVNHLVLTGRLTGDAEAKEFGENTVFSGSIAVNHYDKKEQKEVGDFFNFKVWAKAGKQAEFYKSSLTKGSKIVVEGRLVQERWEKDGQKQSRVIIAANGVTPMSKSKGGASDEAGFPDFPEE